MVHATTWMKMLYLLSLKSGQTVTLAVDVITEGSVVAIAAFFTLEAVGTRRTRVRTHLTLQKEQFSFSFSFLFFK